jgi:hypothetical protein
MRPRLCKKPFFVLAFSLVGTCTVTSTTATKPFPIQKIPTSQPVISSPLVLDLDGDGSKEITFGSWDGNLRVLDAKGDMRSGWPFFVEKGFFGSPAAADLNRDGVSEIIIGADTGALYVFSVDGKVLPGWPQKIGETIWSSPTIIDGLDGNPWIAIASDHFCHLFRPDGSSAPGWPQRIDDWADATVAYQNDTLVLTTLTRWKETTGRVYVWRRDGTSQPNFPVVIPTDIDSSPTLFDLDQDQSPEIIFGDDEGLLHALRLKDAEEAHGWPVRTKDTVEASASIGDINDDGSPDIAIGSWDHRLYVVDTKGKALKGFPFEAQDQIIAQAALVDLNQDKKLEIIFPSKDGNLYGLQHDGSAAKGFPVRLGSPSFSSPWVGDLDQSGALSIVVGAADGLYIIRGVGVLGLRPWPMFRQGPAHRGVVP